MRVRSSCSLISTRPGRGVVTSARRDEGRDGSIAGQAHRERARGLARGELADLHAVDGAVGFGFDHARFVTGSRAPEVGVRVAAPSRSTCSPGRGGTATSGGGEVFAGRGGGGGAVR